MTTILLCIVAIFILFIIGIAVSPRFRQIALIGVSYGTLSIWYIFRQLSKSRRKSNNDTTSPKANQGNGLNSFRHSKRDMVARASTDDAKDVTPTITKRKVDKPNFVKKAVALDTGASLMVQSIIAIFKAKV